MALPLLRAAASATEAQRMLLDSAAEALATFHAATTTPEDHAAAFALAHPHASANAAVFDVVHHVLTAYAQHMRAVDAAVGAAMTQAAATPAACRPQFAAVVALVIAEHLLPGDFLRCTLHALPLAPWLRLARLLWSPATLARPSGVLWTAWARIFDESHVESALAGPLRAAASAPATGALAAATPAADSLAAGHALVMALEERIRAGDRPHAVAVGRPTIPRPPMLTRPTPRAVPEPLQLPTIGETLQAIHSRPARIQREPGSSNTGKSASAAAQHTSQLQKDTQPARRPVGTIMSSTLGRVQEPATQRAPMPGKRVPPPSPAGRTAGERPAEPKTVALPVPAAVRDPNLAPPIRLNAAAIVREEALFRRRAEQEMRRAAEAAAGIADPSVRERRELEDQLRRKQEQQEEMRKAALLAQLTREEAILAKEESEREKQRLAAGLKAQTQSLLDEARAREEEEEAANRRLVEDIARVQEAVRQVCVCVCVREM
jgi:hypothetical protein